MASGKTTIGGIFPALTLRMKFLHADFDLHVFLILYVIKAMNLIWKKKEIAKEKLEIPFLQRNQTIKPTML